MVFSHFSEQRKQREDKSFLQVFIHTDDTLTQNFTHSNIRKQNKPFLFGASRECSLEQITFIKRSQCNARKFVLQAGAGVLVWLLPLAWLKRRSEPFQETGSMHQTRNRHFTTR